MSFLRRAALAVLTFALLVGCDSGVRLSVELQTDFVPGAEFYSVRTTVESASGTQRRWNTPAFEMSNVAAGERLVDFNDVPAGEHEVRVALLAADGGVLAERVIEVAIEDGFTLTAVIPRSCLQRMCADGSSACESDCGDPRCSPETPDFCAEPDCRQATDCDMPTAACGEAACVLGACFSVARDGACEAGQYCDVEAGCATFPEPMVLDAGVPDAGAPDAGPDAGPPIGAPRPRRPANGHTVVPDASTGQLGMKLIANELLDPLNFLRFEVWSCDAGTIAAGGCAVGAADQTIDSTVGEGFVDVTLSGAGTWVWRVQECRATDVCGTPSALAWFHIVEPHDIDGDGFAEIVLSAPSAPDPVMTIDYGELYIFDEDDSGSWTRRSSPLVPPAVDRNRDGLGSALAVGPLRSGARPQIVAGAPLWTGVGMHSGRVVVFTQTGGPTTFAEEVLVPSGPRAGANFGAAVAILGDSDTEGQPGYGVRELAVGAPGEPGISSEVIVYSADLGGGFTERFRVADPEIGDGRFGAAVLGCDIDGDGTDELVIGAPDRGSVYVFASIDGAPPSQIQAPITGSLGFGTSLACGDINRGGVPDLVIGDPVSGLVEVHLSRDGVSAPVVLTAPPGAMRFGYAVDVSDSDADTFPDLNVLAPLSGQVFVYSDDTPTFPSWLNTPVVTSPPAVSGHAEGCIARLGRAGSTAASAGLVYSHVPGGSGGATSWLSHQNTEVSRGTAELGPPGSQAPDTRWGWACR